MTKSKILLRLTVLLLLMAGGSKLWAMNRTIPFANQNRISNNGAGVFTSADNAGNAYALALADLSNIPGITTAGTITIQFDSNIPSGSRWNIGIGNKDVRGTNANGSSGITYSTDGLILRFGTTDGNNYQVNGGTNNNNAFGKSVHATITFNRIEGTYSYTLTDNDNSTVYFSETDIATSVANPTIIEVYSWQNSSSVTLSNVTIQFEDLYFEKAEDVVYLEDLVYRKLTNGTGSNTSATYSDNGYLRIYGTDLYPIKTTGSEPEELTEGTPITVTVTAGTASAKCNLRIKTRNVLDINSMKLGDVFTIGTTLGVLPENSSILVNGVRLTLSNGESHSTVVRSINGEYGLTIIDKNGYTHGNYDQSKDWGTIYKFENTTSTAKTIYVTGYFDSNTDNAQLYDDTHNAVTGQVINNPGDGTLASGSLTLNANSTYYLFSWWHAFTLNTFSGPRFEKGYDVTAINSTYRQAVSYMSSPTYSVVSKAGDLSSASVSVSGDGTVSGLTAGGAVKIQATNGVETVSYVLTVAYEATPYPGKLWDFNNAESMPDLNIYEATGSGNVKGFPWLDGNSNATITIEDGHANTLIDSNGDEWVARLKNTVAGHARDPRWRRVNAVNGDNAFIVPETAGLVFNTGGDCFFVRADRSSHWCWSHVGIRRIGSSFTIPLLKAGDVVEINWKRESSGGGGTFSATNATDLRGKEVTTTFEMTGSQNGTTGGVLDIKKNPGYTSFVATADGNVTFTLQDGGAADILSIRIYSGGYRSTMRAITGADHRTARTSMLLDNIYQEYEYNYCNVLNSTNTGPAWYVLKGYVNGTDNPECMTGTDAGRNFQDGQPYYHQHYDPDGYPVTAAESARLWDLRKNLVGFHMYNANWQSSRNGYNRGRVGATSGYGKVTIRMNNYTNDLQYVIGYTNDITMTFGSAPHQTYPYTWDFGHISMRQAFGRADNALNAIETEGSNSNFSGMDATNWEKNSSGDYILNTDNGGQYGSQYVPGAILVSIGKALSKYPQGTASETYALDELDGLGVTGQVAMQMDKNSSSWDRTPAAARTESLLSMKVSDFIVSNQETEEWSVIDGDELQAGNGIVQFANKGKIEETVYADCNFGYRSDQDAGYNKWVLVKPSRAIAKGDVIAVKAFTDKQPDSNTGIGIFTANASSNQIAILPVTLRYTEQSLTYTVPVGSELIGKTQFYLNRANNSKAILITEIEISGVEGNLPKLDKNLYAVSDATLTIPDLNATLNGVAKQDWIYVSASARPTTVTNATLVTTGTDGPDANQLPMVEDANTHVYKYKVTAAGNVNMTFAAGTKIYKIGVTHILKEIHPVGGTGWATEIRKHAIDHELIGYFTKNDVNAYTVNFDSYDMSTATVALTPINEDGYVPDRTGIVMRLDNIGNLSDANSGKYVPLFYPSYTREESSSPVAFPTNNWMYNEEGGIDNGNLNNNETITVGGVNYTKFILTNVHWLYTLSDQTGQWTSLSNADAAGFHRMHIWNDETLDVMPAHTAYLLVPTDQLPLALWNQPSSGSRAGTIGLRYTQGVTEDIVPIADDSTDDGSGWYTLGGMRLDTPPSQPGLYIYNGQKVVVRQR